MLVDSVHQNMLVDFAGQNMLVDFAGQNQPTYSKVNQKRQFYFET